MEIIKFSKINEITKTNYSYLSKSISNALYFQAFFSLTLTLNDTINKIKI